MKLEEWYVSVVRLLLAVKTERMRDFDVAFGALAVDALQQDS